MRDTFSESFGDNSFTATKKVHSNNIPHHMIAKRFQNDHLLAEIFSAIF